MLLNRSNMAGCSEPCGCNARRSVATPVVTSTTPVVTKRVFVGHGNPTLQRARCRRRGFFNSLETGG